MLSAEAASSSTAAAAAPPSAAAASTDVPVLAPADVDSASWDARDNPSGIRPILQNIVATCNLAVELDLKTIALHARNAEFNPKRFAAVIMRIREPKTTALIFRSGKMVVTGAKSEADARTATVDSMGFLVRSNVFGPV